jgi:Beta-propeller repeat
MNRTARKSLIVTTLVFLFTLFLAACSQSPDTVQTKVGFAPINAEIPLKTRDFGTGKYDSGTGIAANTTGVYVTGSTYGNLDGVNKDSTGVSSDGFIRKYDGGVIWGQQFGTRFSDAPYAIAVGSTGNSYVAGSTDGALGFKVGGNDEFIRKYNSDGFLQWTRQFGTVSYDYVFDIAVDSSENIFVLGQNDSLGFIVHKFNSSGVLLASKTVTSLPSMFPNALAIDSTGSVIVLATWYGGVSTQYNIRIFKFTNLLIDTWNVPFQQTIYNEDGFDITTVGTDIHVTAKINSSIHGARYGKLNAAGTLLAIRQLEPNATCNCTFPRSITADASGNIYIAGDTSGAFSGLINAGLKDIVVFKYNSSSTLIWTKQLGQGSFGTTTDEYANGIAVSDAVYVTGLTLGNFLGDPKYGTNDADAYIAQFDLTTGALLGIDQ